jgi:hypothetical protein
MKLLPIDSLTLFPGPVDIFRNRKGSARLLGKLKQIESGSSYAGNAGVLWAAELDSEDVSRLRKEGMTRGCLQVLERKVGLGCRIKG